MHRFLLLFIISVACAREPTESPSRPSAQALAPTAPRPGALAAETALLALVLSPDGTANFAEVQRRAISYSGPKSEPTHDAGDHVIEVSLEGRPTLRIPLQLGSPKDRLLAARSAWAGGGTVVRAPCYGPGTRFALRSTEHPDARVLTEIELER